MTPDEIKQFIEANYPAIVTSDRSGPNGWSFYYGEIRKGPHSTRIARALEGSGGKANEFKLSATSRRYGTPALVEIRSPQQLRELFDKELRLWKAHFSV